jgi:hypothetical protein
MYYLSTKFLNIKPKPNNQKSKNISPILSKSKQSMIGHGKKKRKNGMFKKYHCHLA